MSANELIQGAVLAGSVGYISVTVMLNTSIGLRMGYDPFRILPISLVWPMLLYEPLDTWAKSGACTIRQ